MLDSPFQFDVAHVGELDAELQELLGLEIFVAIVLIALSGECRDVLVDSWLLISWRGSGRLDSWFISTC